MLLIFTLTLHFLLSLRAATSTASAQQNPTGSATPAADQQSASNNAMSSPSPSPTPAPSSLPPVLDNADATITTTTALRAAVQTWPVHSLFLPIEDPGNLAASIISVHPNHTAYALGCLPPSLRAPNATACPLSHSLTLTEGVSTMIYTQTISDDEISPLTHLPLAVSCELFVPAPAPSHSAPYHPDIGAEHASKAICTAHSAISGLGVEAATTWLASTEITYVDVTVTSGQDKLIATPTPVNAVSSGVAEDGEEGRENAAAALRLNAAGSVWWSSGGVVSLWVMGLCMYMT